MAFETINLGTQPAGTGGDTARSAFEKTNRNFLAVDVLSAAMSQAQFEAIRAQNNEEFAASGFVHFGKHWSGQQSINEGLYPYTTDSAFSNILFMGRNATTAGLSKTNSPVLNIAGVLFYLQNINTFNTSADNKIKFPQAPDGKNTYNKSTGVITTHATVTAAFNAQAADPTNVEVVTDRVDMWGFEAWLEEVNTTNPYIYPNGLIQSQATTMDGIATSASARPVTYYAVFDGDTGSKGKGLNYFALSDVNKKKVLANPKNNLYYLDDGRLVQWRLRQRTIAGAGNGDWVNINSASASPELKFSNSVKIQAQGFKNTTTTSGPSVTTGGFIANGYITTANQLGDLYNSIFTVTKYNSPATDFAVNGQCYFLVCGTVNRLNQGAYHPSFNPSGAGRLNASNLVGTGAFWYSTSVINPTSTVECFKVIFANDDSTSAGVCSGTGLIAGYAVSGRPDGRFYDAIYADGQGGVCRDMRYSAYSIDSVDFAEADQRVKNGTYRGFEKLIFSRVTATQNSVPNNSTINFASAVPSWVKVGDTVISVSGVRSKIGSMSANSIFTLTNNGVMVNEPIVIESELPYSVGGSFLQTDVIGNPANILATPALANGWQGSWIPVIPDGTTKEFLASRKNISAVGRVSQYTTNNGGSWATGSWNIDGVKNSTSSFEPANRVTIVTYQAFARQTENAVNAEVYGGHVGVGRVYSGSYSATDTGSLLCESLLNKILTSATNLPLIDDVALTKTKLQATKKLATSLSWGSTEHTSIFLNTPINNSPAFKALNYNVNLNQQAFIQYAYTELKHNGTNWGDDGKVTIVDNQSTKTDLNGNTVLVGTAKLRELIGWIKNKV